MLIATQIDSAAKAVIRVPVVGEYGSHAGVEAFSLLCLGSSPKKYILLP
jgi:hypothetical protein